MQRILVAIDFSELAPRVLAFSQELARATGAELFLVHVAAPDPDWVGFDNGPQSVRDGRAEELRQEHRDLQAMAKACQQAGLSARALLIQGPTVDKLLEQADTMDADLIVVGPHGRGALARILLGSVSEGLLRATKRPVVVVPRGG